MKMQYPFYKMGVLCGLFGKSRQAYYEREHYVSKQHLEEEVLLCFVNDIRKDFPRMGCKKLLIFLQNRLQQADIKIGRDAFFGLLKRNQLLVKRRRSSRKTTYSDHWMRKYPNLVRDFVPSAPNQLWVSDITYVDSKDKPLYLSLITDAYSRKIVGWNLSPTLAAIHTVNALKMGLRTLPANHSGLIHHSDRGVQYCCNEYVKELSKHGVLISMTESGDPLENALAERVNGILKTEWLNKFSKQTPRELLASVNKVIMLYNEKRPHQSISYQTPSDVHAKGLLVERKWKNYYPMKEKRETSLNFASQPKQNSQAISEIKVSNFEDVKLF